MRLLKFTIGGYRRFEEQTAINLEDRLVAIVGPNEAGKSSLLAALTRFNDVNAFDLQRDQPRKSNAKPELKGQFVLEEADLALLDGIPGGSDVRWVNLSKTTSGPLTWSLDPYPHRDKEPRRLAYESLEALRGDPALDNEWADPTQPWDPERFDRVLTYLQSREESLVAENISEIEQLTASLKALSYPDQPDADADGRIDEEEVAARLERGVGRSETVNQLVALVPLERLTHPATRCRSALEQRVPTFLLFDDAARSLHPSYDLNSIPEPLPAALKNVADLAGLDLDNLRFQLQNGNLPDVEYQIEQANSQLREDFATTWAQSDVYVRLRLDASVLQLFVSVEGGGTYSWLNERSDGLLAFVALRAFVANHRDPKPILLIDEAETHLHYDAQVDLIEVLAHQDLASKVIYTTHSVGCLPPDLGSGLRAVVPTEGKERSTINNSFWTAGPGFTPLLFGMGAALLAFAIPRRVVLTEGASDCILLPTLIRQATGSPELDLRFAPGLSNSDDDAFKELDIQGGRTAFLVDGDGGGGAIRKRLERAGVEASHVISLSDLSGSPSTIEDLVDAEVLASSLNVMLGRWRTVTDQITADDLGATARWSACESWCEARSLRPPSKLQLAQEVIDSTGNEPQLSRVFDTSQRAAIEELYGRLQTVLAT